MNKITAKELIRLEFVEDQDVTLFCCNSCGVGISSWNLLTPCHPDTHFPEGSGYGGPDTSWLFCIPKEEGIPECTAGKDGGPWSGTINDVYGQLICDECRENPFLKEEE